MVNVIKFFVVILFFAIFNLFSMFCLYLFAKIVGFIKKKFKKETRKNVSNCR